MGVVVVVTNFPRLLRLLRHYPKLDSGGGLLGLLPQCLLLYFALQSAADLWQFGSVMAFGCRAQIRVMMASAVPIYIIYYRPPRTPKKLYSGLNVMTAPEISWRFTTTVARCIENGFPSLTPAV